MSKVTTTRRIRLSGLGFPASQRPIDATTHEVEARLSDALAALRNFVGVVGGGRLGDQHPAGQLGDAPKPSTAAGLIRLRLGRLEATE